MVDVSQFPETAKFEAWFNAERAKGLQSVHFSTANLTGATVESFCAEVNRALAAPEVPDQELL